MGAPKVLSMDIDAQSSPAMPQLEVLFGDTGYKRRGSTKRRRKRMAPPMRKLHNCMVSALKAQAASHGTLPVAVLCSRSMRLNENDFRAVKLLVGLRSPPRIKQEPIVKAEPLDSPVWVKRRKTVVKTELVTTSYPVPPKFDLGRT